MSERGAISPERDEIVGERGAELSGAVCCDFERWSGGSEHPRERGAEILTAQLRSHALVHRAQGSVGSTICSHPRTLFCVHDPFPQGSTEYEKYIFRS